MSLDNPESLSIDGKEFSVAIIASRYNFGLVNALLESVHSTLTSSGVLEDNIEVVRVPGSSEIPHAASLVAKAGEFDVLIALGLIIEGDTNHDEIIGHATANALQQVALQHEMPVINGIITVRNTKQAEDRITGEIARGREFAHAALEMAQLSQKLVMRVMEADMDASLDKLDWLDEDLEDDDDGDWSR